MKKDEQFLTNIRLPQELADQLKVIGKQENRSLNAQMIFFLKKSVDNSTNKSINRSKA